MKRFIYIALALLCLTACGQTVSPSADETLPAPSVPAATPSTGDQSSPSADQPSPSPLPSPSPSPEASPSPTAPPSPSPSPPPPSPSPSPLPSPKLMTISSGGISGGVLDDRYGMRGEQQSDGVPTLSFPVEITDAPEAAVCFVVKMIDPDSKPLCGYEWVHWMAVFNTPSLAENASFDAAGVLVQGMNDFGTVGYGGPTPPDKPHTYEITVYAIDCELSLTDGFSQEALIDEIKGHVLAEAVITAIYSN